MNTILQEICDTKRSKIKQKGFALGHNIPSSRIYPINLPNLNKPLFISEIKTKSPTHGIFDENLDPIALAGLYLDSGSSAISVLCEEDYFNGSLLHLMDIKKAYPKSILLRKDFILFKEEIEISYLCGADMVLLIATLFLQNRELFAILLDECKKYGLMPLVEVHNKEDLEFALSFNIELLGINSRNLKTFKIDKQEALLLRENIPSDKKVIFESGIKCDFDAYIAASCGFSGILCGEYLLSSENRSKILYSLKKSFQNGLKDRFYKPFFTKVALNAPIIKICGVTNIDDALDLAEAGVDILGFIICDSKRKIDIFNLKNISHTLKKLYPHILKVCVILEDKNLLRIARNLLDSGVIDALQLHSASIQSPNVYANYNLKNANFPFFISINVPKDSSNKEVITEVIEHSISPFILLDSSSETKGGSGKMISSEILSTLSPNELYLSGGITADNIENFLSLFPRMLDICSGSESCYGLKDMKKVRAILKYINKEHKCKI